MTVRGWRPVRAATRVAHEPCVISERARARSRVRAWGALRATWRRSSAVPPQRVQSTRNTKPDLLRRKGIKWERLPSIQGPHKLQLSNWTRFKCKTWDLMGFEGQWVGGELYARPPPRPRN